MTALTRHRNIYDLTSVWHEILLRLHKLDQAELSTPKPDGTSARNGSSLRVTRNNFQTAQHQDEMTWLMTVRMALADVSVVEHDDVALRRGLVQLAAEVLGWIDDIDQRR